ncbi:MAG: zinc ribbon domain-containing protein [Acetatifactor sp.]|nr:zinc ribbon domain-containing protein [Acetatifactor sp.]
MAEGYFIAEFTEENYSYMGHVFCGKCGYPLYHRIYSNGNRLSWDCSEVKRYGNNFCKGVNIPDGISQKMFTSWNIRMKWGKGSIPF